MQDKEFKYKGFDVKIYKVKKAHRAVIQCEDYLRILMEQNENNCYIATPRSDKEWETVVKEIVDLAILNNIEGNNSDLVVHDNGDFDFDFDHDFAELGE